ncbi:hypothetical protein OE88DRAFT_372753 [Heliocybe sulcata]|uniref:Uncharacterized protein n=1 Tax=Heliocybe sulcata TaxID=5364 RepID=A0A5C3MXH7_9AGAM|nr:hypothetical protein OE88DRAFT_372753 [Heliocybe sulcata]
MEDTLNRISIVPIPAPVPDDVHGLTYPPAFLPSLPALSPHPDPVRVLSAAQFADMHFRYTMSHAPDSVLFPFLHGLEDGSDALRAFFGSASFGNANSARNAVRVPRFRGLLWVATDLPSSPPPSSPSSRHATPSPHTPNHPLDVLMSAYNCNYTSSSSSSSSSEDDDDEYDSDYVSEGSDDAMDVDVQMHPVSHRAPTPGHDHRRVVFTWLAHCVFRRRAAGR